MRSKIIPPFAQSLSVMHILHIAPTPFFADRGCHIRILGEIQALQRLGHHVSLATYHLGRNIPDIPAHRSLRVPWYNKLDAGFSWHKIYLDILLLGTVLRVGRDRRPDVIHAHLHEGAAIGWAASLLLSWRRIPVVFDVQGSLTGELQAYASLGALKRLLFLFRWGEKIVCRLPDYFVCSSESVTNFLREECGVPDSMMEVLRESVEDEACQTMDSSDLRTRLGIPENSSVVIFTGSLLAAKGVGHLLRAIPMILAESPDVRFVLVGYPVEDCKLELERENLEHVVSLCGRVDYFDLFSYLALADVAVDPKSESSGEGSGKITNYMAAGLPVVCFDTPANRAVLGDDGVYARIGDDDDLARSIVSLLHNPGKAKSIGASNRQRIQTRYSRHSCASTLECIYRRIMARKQSGNVPMNG